MKTRSKCLLMLLLTTLTVTGLWLQETAHPSTEQVQQIEKGMTYADVVEALGTRYDSADRGEYPKTDRVIREMPNGGAVHSVCWWRFSFSFDTLYVGFDENNVVISTTQVCD